MVNYSNTVQPSDLDNMAMLVLKTSCRQEPSFNPNTINERCVAAVVAFGFVVFAANDVWRVNPRGKPSVFEDYGSYQTPFFEYEYGIFFLIMNELYVSGYSVNPRFLKNPAGENDRSYHAEMQLLDYIYGDQRSFFYNNEIGVSKPVCALCANELRSRGISFTETHGGWDWSHYEYQDLMDQREHHRSMSRELYYIIKK